MPDPDVSPPPGRTGHGLGPHLVGSRVVVRHRVPGETAPSGRPLLNDVLGVLRSFDDDALVVEPDGPGDRAAVRIRRADVVTGKPVPPRSSARLRVDPEDAERVAARGWPAIRTQRLGDWLLRASGGYSARANSVLAVGSPGLADDAASRAVVEWYRARELPPWAQVVVGSPQHLLLERQGWRPARPGEADTDFHLASVARVRRAARALPSSGTPGAQVEVRDRLDDEWLAGDAAAARHPEAARAVLAGAPLTGFAVVKDAWGDVLARGRASVDGDWVGLTSIAVEPSARRSGLGTLVVRELVGWGAERGALTAYLQTSDDNPAAVALYTRLGFAVHHTYRYLRHA